MNYLFYCRIKWPVLLLTFGVTALLNQMNILSFGRSWPIYLIVYGVLRVLEGAALANSNASATFSSAAYAGAAAASYPQPGSRAATAASGFGPGPGVGTELTRVVPAPIQSAHSSEEES